MKFGLILADALLPPLVSVIYTCLLYTSLHPVSTSISASLAFRIWIYFNASFFSDVYKRQLMDGEHASVQIAANNALAGPNGIGGITVDLSLIHISEPYAALS